LSRKRANTTRAFSIEGKKALDGNSVLRELRLAAKGTAGFPLRNLRNRLEDVAARAADAKLALRVAPPNPEPAVRSYRRAEFAA